MSQKKGKKNMESPTLEYLYFNSAFPNEFTFHFISGASPVGGGPWVAASKAQALIEHRL